MKTPREILAQSFRHRPHIDAIWIGQITGTHIPPLLVTPQLFREIFQPGNCPENEKTAPTGLSG